MHRSYTALVAMKNPRTPTLACLRTRCWWRGPAAWLAFALSLPWGPLVAAPSEIEVDAARAGELIEVRAQATVKAPLAVVWSTLTDYERLPEFIPGLKKSRILSRVGATTMIEQSGEARFLFWSVPIEVTVESTERPPHIEVRRVAGSLRYLRGRYETEVLADLSMVQLRWIGTVAPDTVLPPFIGNTLVRISIHHQFAGMVREIERREAARRQGAAVPGSK